jgi:CBS domain containing-hemolysin-like protein
MEFVLLLLLIAVNGLFALSEMAVVSSRKSRLQRWRRAPPRRCRAALALANDPSRFGRLDAPFGGIMRAWRLERGEQPKRPT